MTSYQLLIAEIDRQGERLRSLFPDDITCRLRCTGCCQQHLSVFEVEAVALQQHILTLDPSQQVRLREQARQTLEREVVLQEQAKSEVEGSVPDLETALPCPALVDGVCGVYPARPIICRTHGFPLLFEISDKAFLDVCPLNFTGSEEVLGSLTEDSMFILEVVNEKLVRANFSREGSTPGTGVQRRSIADIILSTNIEEGAG